MAILAIDNFSKSPVGLYRRCKGKSCMYIDFHWKDVVHPGEVCELEFQNILPYALYGK